ncbi:MAG: DUF3187 family protein [Spirochaetales bacterium]|nr:DUF3187 family protein [Spirochaetales bacterium]
MIAFLHRGLPGAALFFCLLLSLPPLFADSEYIMTAPLYGKNYYLPHLPVYSFPGFSPRSGRTGDRYLTLSYTGLDEFVAYDPETPALDYESSVLEASYHYRPGDRLILGADLRVISYYAGFMDNVIETFHSLFGFPNGGRELFPRNDLYINMDNRLGADLTQDKPLIAMGDTDLSLVWTFRETSELSLALAGALKLPTGSLETLSGSGYADTGLQILGEWRFHPRWSLHFQEGVVLPGDWMVRGLTGEPGYAEKPQSQSYLGLRFSPREDWAVIAQFRINTSPVSSDRVRVYSSLGEVTLFTLPQTAFQLGVKKTFGDWILQCHFEEDPFTYEGADILVSVGITKFL